MFILGYVRLFSDFQGFVGFPVPAPLANSELGSLLSIGEVMCSSK